MKIYLAVMTAVLFPFQAGAQLSDKETDLASRLASAFAATDICNKDVDRVVAAQEVRKVYGTSLSVEKVTELMYRITVAMAIQGVQTRGKNSDELFSYCGEVVRHFGPYGSDIRGLLR